MNVHKYNNPVWLEACIVFYDYRDTCLLDNYEYKKLTEEDLKHGYREPSPEHLSINRDIYDHLSTVCKVYDVDNCLLYIRNDKLSKYYKYLDKAKGNKIWLDCKNTGKILNYFDPIEAMELSSCITGFEYKLNKLPVGCQKCCLEKIIIEGNIYKKEIDDKISKFAKRFGLKYTSQFICLDITKKKISTTKLTDEIIAHLLSIPKEYRTIQAFFRS